MNSLRRIPVCPLFMDKRVNDILYGHLICVSSFDLKTNLRYVEKKSINFSELELIFEGKMNRLKFSRDFKELEKRGLVKEGKVENLEGEEVSVYFIEAGDPVFLYRLIDQDVLATLVGIGELQVIKIYAHLISKFEYYQSLGKPYFFSQKYLIEMLGQQSSTNLRDRELIKKSLLILEDLGLIKYTKSCKNLYGEFFYMNKVIFVKSEL